MLRLDLRRARLRERGFGVEHVELRAGAGRGARVGFAQGLLGFLLDFLLRFQRLARLNEIRIRRAHRQFNLPRLVIEIGLGVFVLGLGLDYFAARQQAVENVPVQLRAGVPAVDVVIQFHRRRELRVIPVVAGEDGHRRLVAGLGVDDVEPLQFHLFAQRRQFRAA